VLGAVGVHGVEWAQARVVKVVRGLEEQGGMVLGGAADDRVE